MMNTSHTKTTIDTNIKTTDTLTASLWLQEGKLLAYPTESVWGIGCDAFNEQAVKQILAIKNRPIEKGMIVVTDSMARLEPLLTALSASQQQAVQKQVQTQNQTQKQTLPDSWQPMDNQAQNQQATTWLLPIPTEVNIPNWITGTHNSLAVRVIAHPIIKKLCKNMVAADNPFGFIISTSCNPANHSPAVNYQQAFAYFGNQIGYLQGDTLGYSKPSQIRDVITGQVLR